MCKEIVFKHARGGKIPVFEGNTCFPDLWPIAAVDISTSILTEKIDEGIAYDCPTDNDGLETLIDRGSDLVDNINSASLAISMIFTDEDNACSQVQANLAELAWLQAGLIELAMKVSSSVDNMRRVLETNKAD